MVTLSIGYIVDMAHVEQTNCMVVTQVKRRTDLRMSTLCNSSFFEEHIYCSCKLKNTYHCDKAKALTKQKVKITKVR